MPDLRQKARLCERFVLPTQNVERQLLKQLFHQ